MKNKRKVGVVGLWHLGSVYATALAHMGHEVVCFDFDKKVIANFKEGVAPLFEPGLEKYLLENTKRLTFTSEEKDLLNCEYLFITHDVVVDEDDQSDLSTINKIFKLVKRISNERMVVIVSSQIPVGTSRNLVTLLKKNKGNTASVAYFPENLRLGSAYECFLNPERIVLGSDDVMVIERFKKDFKFPCPIIGMGLESAEMTKHALNTYLATCVSFSSELSDIAERVGADMNDVVKAMKLDRRVSQYAPLNPGFGFAGATLGRDVQSLKNVGMSFGYTTEIMKAVYKVNQNRLATLLDKAKQVYPNLKGKKIGVLGLTYKPNTNTLRRSMSLEACELFNSKGASVIAYDPVIRGLPKEYRFVSVKNSIEEFARNLDLVILMTDWAEFKNISPEVFCDGGCAKVVIDTKNFLDKERYISEGFIYKGIGM
jgi:UDPglucose 6-dehydrogenase